MVFLNFGISWVLGAVVLVLACTGCKQRTESFKSPAHYDFSKAFTHKLDPRLVELSGIAWDAKNNVFYAVHDESDSLFVLDKENKIIKEAYNIGQVADYEDVAILNGIPYILKSDGTIIKVVKDSTGRAIMLEVGESKLSGDKDFETMYGDVARNALVVMCKNCAVDDENSVSAFAFYPDSIGYDSKPLFVVDAGKIDQLSPKNSSKFQPSAAAVNPILKKLFIVSSASNQLAITDLDGKVESVYRLAPKMFPQAEGITFQSDGDMYISNEGLPNGRKPTMLKFEFIPITDTAKKIVSKTGYNFSEPDEKLKLGKHLKEISGMAWVAGKDILLAENDEKGEILIVDFKNKKDDEGRIKFAGKGDYEDIVYTEQATYLLISTGTVVKVITKDSSATTEEFVLPKSGTNEFESMYLDADGKSLILLCKDCDKEKNQIRMAHRFNLSDNSFDPAAAYIVQVSEIQKILNNPEQEFKPSAAAINPINGKLYMIASVGKIIVIADRNGKVEEVVQLDPILFNQPEGMTFAPNGDLYISNEAAEAEPTILRFVYKKQD